MLHDADIREPLFDFLEETYGKTRILEEKNTGRSRADVVMVTENEVIGLEIKSDADSYQRLSGQVKDYDRYYDRNFVVIGSSLFSLLWMQITLRSLLTYHAKQIDDKPCLASCSVRPARSAEKIYEGRQGDH